MTRPRSSDTRRAEARDGFRFRVSDAARVPLHGYLLRLRLLEGRPSLERLRPGSRVRLRAPNGKERVIRVLDCSVAGGRATQKRLERTGEVDILIADEEAVRDGLVVDVGWDVTEAPAALDERAA